MKSPRGCLIAMLSLAITGACASGSGRFVWVDDYQATPSQTTGEYMIKAGDLLDVRVFEQDRLSARAVCAPTER